MKEILTQSLGVYYSLSPKKDTRKPGSTKKEAGYAPVTKWK
jgi:hypothetical protein